MRSAIVVCAFGLLVGCRGSGESSGPPSTTTTTNASVYDFTVKTLDGRDEPLSKYKGKVALVVNTASECGYTPQYAGLEKLYEAYQDRGFVILGFPSNDFGAQEPGTDAEIATFASHEYGIKFPLFSKSKVKGDGEGKSVVFDMLGKAKGEPKWNFHKYLLDKKGVPVAAFPSKVAPDDPGLKTEIENALKGS